MEEPDNLKSVCVCVFITFVSYLSCIMKQLAHVEPPYSRDVTSALRG